MITIKTMNRATLGALVQEQLRAKEPPAVGEEPIKDTNELIQTTGVLKIISPTDCVKDRLTGFYHDNDRQCLDQAILVAQNNTIDLNEVKRWSIGDGMGQQFAEISSLF